MNRRLTLAVCVLALPILLGGCLSRLAKEGLGAWQQGAGRATPLQPVALGSNPYPLGAYQRFEIAPFPDKTDGQAPMELFELLPGTFLTELTKKGIPNALSGKTLLVRGEVFYYETAPLTGQIFGPLEEAVARVELVDKASGQVLGVANCVGRSSSSSAMGVKTKANGLAKAIVDWIDKLYPKEQKIKKD